MGLINRVLGLNVRTKEQIIEEYRIRLEQIRAEHNQILQNMSVRQEGKEPTPKSDISEIMFSVGPDYKIRVNVNWGKLEDDRLAEPFGVLLYHVHSGNIASECERILIEAAEERPHARQFINKAMETWRKHISYHDPVMRPSEVFGIHKEPPKP